MNTELLIFVAVAVVVAIMALPLLGNVLAMVLGLLSAVRRRRIEPNARAAGSSWQGPIEARLQGAAMALGSWLAIDESSSGRRQRLRAEARETPDRRFSERRMSARRWHARENSERRYRERRAQDQRRHGQRNR